MKSLLRKAVLTIAVVSGCVGGVVSECRGETVKPASPARDYPFKPVPFTAVHLTDNFWAPRLETNRSVTIPFAFEQCERSGRMDNFIRAAMALAGQPLTNNHPPPFPFDDTDPYKVLEGASYSLAVQPDPKMREYLDNLIAEIGQAQEPDGYLYTARTINPQHPHDWSGHERWVNDPDESHELYDAGHLFEAAAAHYQATGETNLLNIALKEANLLCATFGPDKLHIWPGHEIVEMGLAKIYRVTGDQRYLELAKFFIDTRGPGGDEYHQSHIKPVEQTEAVGHAVRAGYLYSGMADVAALTGDQQYVRAIDAIWDNAVGKKLYITGGIGAVGGGEAFGPNYFLPNMSAYCETCAAVANDYWNERLFLLHGDGKYVDVLERTLYNGLLSGVSLDGKGFFYPNPLESNGQHSRSPWFGVACCPGNITRFMPSLPGYFYARRGDTVFVNLYAGGTADISLDDGRSVRITQETRYPWDGAIKLTIDPSRSGEFVIKARIPGWARGEAVPGDLYRFADQSGEPATLKVNARPEAIQVEKGYVTLRRSWKAGDVIELNLPMPVRRVAANDLVKADRGRVALQRGPLVYCAEWPDNPNGKVRNLLLPDNQPLTAEFEPSLLNGVEVITGRSYAVTGEREGKLEKTAQAFKAIPYFAWANRGRGQMAVWIADSESSVKVPAKPTIASASQVLASNSQRRNLRVLIDQVEPDSSNDAEAGHFDWWPRKGTDEWAQLDFPRETTVSNTSIYWFDDTGAGECRIPASFRVLYKDGGDWKPVETTDAFVAAKDKFNKITFKPVKTIALRIELKEQEGWAAGLEKWKVE